MIRAIYFDLDNTLVNRNASIDKFARRFVKTFSAELKEITPSRVSSIIKKQDNGGYLPHNSKYNKIFQAIGSELSSQLNWARSKPDAVLSDFWKEEFPKCSIEMEGATTLVNYLHQKGYHLGVISNGAENSRVSTIKATPFGHLFSQIVSSEKFGISKPDSSIFEHTLSLANYKAHECVYIGDHPINDVHGASNAGLKAVWLRGFHKEISLPSGSVTINRLNDIIDVLNL
ncbi:HAD-IA family hydrolase [Vibrio hannami]|uniref:HAD family hydrolase n=1 Tax=Vibrio hannami TaxID=2717094 RepID=UPI00240F2B26|nr:HAD-IA family hydrolase [Vibrio hannami]MDG3085050.1 HAD-IA family hydrolase [Vibrio hannami]